LRQIIRNTIAILNRAERKKGLALIGLNLLISVLDVGFLACLLFLVQLYSGGIPPGRAVMLPEWLINTHSLWPLGVFFLLFAVKNLASFLVYRAQCDFRYAVTLRISRHNLLQYLEGSYEEFVHVDSAVHIAQVNLQPAEFSQHVMEGLQQSIAEWAMIGLTVTAILLFNAGLFLLLLLLLLPPVVMAAWLTRKQLLAARANIANNREIAWQRLKESIAGFVESNLYNKKDFLTERYHRSERLQNKFLSALQTMQGAPTRLTEVFAVFGFLALISISHFSGGGHGTAFVTVGAFLAAAYKIIPGIARILNLNGQIRAYSYTLTDLVKKRGNHAHARQNSMVETIESISFRDVSFRYDDRYVLRRLSLDIVAGGFVGIEGHSGRGKTTMLNILLGFLTPESGEVLFNGMKMSVPERKHCWRRISYVKQQPFILHDTLLTNITMEEEHYDAEKLNHVLAISGLDAIVGQWPLGVRTWISENGRNISGGQRQRIMIARALYKEADVYILDEPFSELDEASEVRMLGYFRQLTLAGKIVILVTHNTKSLAYCHSLIPLGGEVEV
jgi:ABC-type bacteriocin/lantibiotic exporter with double-glycine peptidase domain